MCKKCTKCGTSYDDIDGNFYRNSIAKDGYNTKCKLCRDEVCIKYRNNNKEKIYEYIKKIEINI